MSHDDLLRRLAVLRSCDRVLSGSPPGTMRERLQALAAMPEADDWPDRYGEGGPVAVLEERVAGLLGCPAAVYFPTGTMAQQVALRFWASRTGNPVVAMHPLNHLEVHERHAYATLSGLRPAFLTAEHRPPAAADVAALPEPFGTLLLELPLRDAGFLLPTWAELVATVEAGRARDAHVHLDGARLWESAVHFGQSLAVVAGLADSVYVSFYKSLHAPSGAALAGPAELAGYARAWRHRHGGQLFQQWPAALAALAGLDTELPALPARVRHAAEVAAALAGLPGARVHPDPPHTHQFQLWLPHPAEALNRAVLELGEQEKVWFVGGWRASPVPGMSLAEVTIDDPGLSWTATDVTEVAGRFLDRLSR